MTDSTMGRDEATPPQPAQPAGVHAEYVVCASDGCACRADGAAHGPYWRRFWERRGQRWSRYVHRGDAVHVAVLCGRGGGRRLGGPGQQSGADAER